MKVLIKSGAVTTAMQWMPQSITVFVAMVFTLMYFSAALPRILYPYDLDFLEDSVLMESLRIANDQPVYIPPNAEFNPHVYMPLFFWLGGMLFKLGGPSLLLLRLISLSATLTTTVMIYWIAKRESGLYWIAISCAGLFLGGYSISGFWYELARVDSLFVALTLCGITLAIYSGDSNRRLVLSALLLVLAAFTKQTGLVVGIGVASYLFITIKQRAAWFFIPFSGANVILLFGLNIFTHGWFFYHVLHIGSADPIKFSRLMDYITSKLFGAMAGLSLMTIITVFLGVSRTEFRIMSEQPWLVGIGMAVIISGMGRIRVGGNLNNLMPAYALLCLAPAILVHEGTNHNFFRAYGSRRMLVPSYAWLIAILILAQFAVEVYSPSSRIPTAAMRENTDHFIQRIASFPGPVLVMMHPYYALLADKDPSTQIATLWYVRERGTLPLPNDFVKRIKNQFYSAIISDESSFETQQGLQKLIAGYYFPAETLDSSQAAATNTGVIVRPKVIYLPYQP